MPCLKEISPIKKAIVGLSLIGAGAMGAVGNHALSNVDEHTALGSFLSNTSSVITSAFDRSNLKQVELTDLQSLVSFMEQGKIRGSSFRSDPKPHMQWLADQLQGDKVVRIDVNDKDGLNGLRDSALKDLITIVKASGGDPNSEKTKSLLDGVLKSAFGYKDGVAGYAITKLPDNTYEFNVGELVENDSQSKFVQTIELKKPTALGKVISKEIPGLSLVNTAYSSDVVEALSSIGVKASNQFLEIEAIHQIEDQEGMKEVFTRHPAALGVVLLGDQLKDENKTVDDFVISDDLLLALNTYKSLRMNGALSSHENITKQDIKDLAKLLKTNGISDPAMGKLVMQFDSIRNNVIKTEAHPSVTALKKIIDQPCSNGVGDKAQLLIEDPGFTKAFECANQYGYSLPTPWMDARMDPSSQNYYSMPASLLGFDNGVAVFAAGFEGEGLGYSFSSTRLDQGTGIEKYDTGYETTFAVVNPFHESIKDLSAKDHAITLQFVAKHEVAHSLIGLNNHQKPVDALHMFRLVAEEIDSDVYAVQELLKFGHSAEEVLQMHKRFLKISENSALHSEIKHDDSFLKEMRDKVWLNGDLVSKDLAKNALKKMSERGSPSSGSFLPTKQGAVEQSNRLEFAVRHSEVEKVVQRFSEGQYTDVLNDLEIEQRPRFSDRQSAIN